MGTYYHRFLEKHIDLTPLGIERREENTPYFCTPRGADVIGWSGVDGIHYCFVRGFGEMVFAVNPMEAAPNYVRPLAGSFADFLRLLLAGKDANLLQQAWQWSKQDFDQAVGSSALAQPVYDTVDQIEKTMHLLPMEKPWEYMKQLQDGFDYSKIKYPEEFLDPDRNPNAPFPQWAVYFDGSIYGHFGRAKAGREIPVRKEFRFADRTWLVPAVYVCTQGLVIDFCMRVEAENYQKFYEMWNEKYSGRDGQQLSRRERLQMEIENPLCLKFWPEVSVNGRELQERNGSGDSYIPNDSNDWEVRQIMEHYRLDQSYAWTFTRICFQWATRQRPEIKTIKLTMRQEPVRVPGEAFEIRGPGEQISLKRPGGRGEIRLSVQKLEERTLEIPQLAPEKEMEYPTHYTYMSYTLSPEPEPDYLTIDDLRECDCPRVKQTQADPNASGCEAASIGIIGGADGPVSFIIDDPQQAHQFCACSALRFEPAERIRWYPVFQDTEYEPAEVLLWQSM